MIVFCRQISLVTLIYLLIMAPGLAQETVFSGLRSDLKRADRYYRNHNYQNALDLFLQAEKKGKANQEIYLKIARIYRSINEPEHSTIWFEKYLESNRSLPVSDAYNYAESLTSQGEYEKAIKWYKKYNIQNPDNQDVIEKIWRLKNIEYLYTDSTYYEVKKVAFNTKYAEYGPAYMGDGLIFVSNRKDKGGIIRIDPITNHPFQSLYYVKLLFDSVREEYSFKKPRSFLKGQSNKWHQGVAAAAGSKLIFTKTSTGRENTESRYQLYWLENVSGNWKREIAFEYNSVEYSVSHPTLSKDGKTLFFVSDMPGGLGGNDLYVCTRSSTGWSQPRNLGETINTTADETAPFIHNSKTLYFASNGHGGFGGLDVFKVLLGTGDEFEEVQNLGFPINTPSDDFGLILNEEGTHGFFASNRGNGGFNDDLYEVIVDLQSYPLIISGIVRFNNPDWLEPYRLDILPNAQLKLVDNLNNVTVYKTYTDQHGTFSLKIPYSSKYKLQVSQKLVGQPMVSLEIPRNRKLHTAHEIVVVKEKFK